MTSTDWQDKTASPEMTRLRERLGEVQKIRDALNRVQRAVIGSEGEGEACDVIQRALDNLWGFHRDASSNNQVPAGEPRL